MTNTPKLILPAALGLLLTPAAVSAAEFDPKWAPVEFYACTYQDGKNYEDLKKVSDKFRDYAMKNEMNYSAWLLVPEYTPDLGYDVGWLGAWPDGEAFGVVNEQWRATGQDLQAEFDAVVDCGSGHGVAMSKPINAPESTPEDGILLFYACNLHEGKTSADAYAAHLKAGTVMKAKGSLSVSWFFEPAAGASRDAPDYYHVVGFYRYSDVGANMEMYFNGGGRKEMQDRIGKVASCSTPTIFGAHSVRAPDES